MKNIKKIERNDDNHDQVTARDSISLAYKDFLNAKRVIIIQGRISVGVSTALAKGFESFSQAFFNLNTDEFLIERENMIALGASLSSKHQNMLKALIANEARLANNSEREEQFWLSLEDKTNYYQKRYQIFISQLQEEIDNNNYRSLVQYLMLEFSIQGLAEVVNMAKTEPYKEKYSRGYDYLKNNHQIEIQPNQFRHNSQVLGSNLNNFYGIIFEGQKIISTYPPEFQDKFAQFLNEIELSLLPDKTTLRGIVASKIISLYLSDETAHELIQPIYEQIIVYLQDASLDVCLSYIKVKDEPPQKYIPETVFQLISSCIENHKQMKRKNSASFEMPKMEPRPEVSRLRSPSGSASSDNNEVTVKEQTNSSKTLRRKDSGLHRFFSLLPSGKKNNESPLLISEPIFRFGSTDSLNTDAQVKLEQQKAVTEVKRPSSTDELSKPNSSTTKKSNLKTEDKKESSSPDLGVHFANNSDELSKKSPDFAKKRALVENLFKKKSSETQEQFHSQSPNQNFQN